MSDDDSYIKLLSDEFANFLKTAGLAPRVAPTRRRVPIAGSTIYMREPFDDTCGAFSVMTAQRVEADSCLSQDEDQVTYLCNVLLNKPSSTLRNWLAEEIKVSGFVKSDLHYEESPFIAPVILCVDASDPDWFVIDDLQAI